MCGICGRLNFDRNHPVSPVLIKNMADAIYHRGPDDEGYFISGCLGLGFRRLSIIDLSTGHQPISNEDGTIWIVFNGEIYNYQELRGQLESRGHVFRSNTDTEVIVHLYEDLGEECVQELRGMFAFAVWDSHKEKLMLARDRVGIKPLYYRVSNQCLHFGSEIKSILADPEVSSEISPQSVDRFLTYYFLPGEETMLRDVQKLLPGHYLVCKGGDIRISQYWDIRFSPTPRKLKDCEEELLALIEQVVQSHLIADVPVGFLLSGGVDSTALLGMSGGKSRFPISSYTLGFSAAGLPDERPYARLAAERYGSVHHDMTITSKEFAEFLPNFAWFMEEPCCEPQAIALYYVTRLAKQHVKVLISGEGGDEAFAGYPIYRNLLWLEKIKALTAPLNSGISSSLLKYNKRKHSARITKYASILDRSLESYYFSRTSNPGQYFNSNQSDLYSPDFIQHIDHRLSMRVSQEYCSSCGALGVVNQMLYTDTKTSLPDDLLLKADKMTMANSVELRVPLLDHKILEFAATLPENFKVRGITTKYIAKRALRRKVPREILERKKAGFPVPHDAWIRTDLNDWVHDLLLDSRATQRGYFKRNTIAKLLEENRRYHNRPKEVLSLISLELWHRFFLERKN